MDANSAMEPIGMERSLVFVTVGTDHHPFDRLCAWADAWVSAARHPEIPWFVQSGTSRAPATASTSAGATRATAAATPRSAQRIALCTSREDTRTRACGRGRSQSGVWR